MVNEVGVDPNRVLDFPHTSGLIQFVCGLGPRKGSALIKVRNFTFTRHADERTEYDQHVYSTNGSLKPTYFIDRI